MHVYLGVALMLVLGMVTTAQGDCDDNNKFYTDSRVNAKPECPTPRDCKEWYNMGMRRNGVYPIDPDNEPPFQVYCDMTTDGGGWTVFQRRINGSLSFHRNWNQYEEGFGDLNGEFWLGLEKIHRLSPKMRQHSLRVELTDRGNNKKYAKYSYFHVRDATFRYQYMLEVGKYSGNAGDRLTPSNGQKFTTNDRDNDHYRSNFATQTKGAWWFAKSYISNLNCYYSLSRRSSFLLWNSFRYIIKAEMKLRQN